MSHDKPFYDKQIDRRRERATIERLLSKYRQQPVSEELRCTIHEELTHAKFLGELTLPFEVVLRESSPSYSGTIEVILDSKA